MKATRFSMIALVFVVALTSCFAKDKMITPEQLPAAARTFITTNFPDNPVLFAQKDSEFMKTRYEVRLKDGTEIDFDKKGEWDKVDCQMRSVPEALVPAVIAQYVKTNFSGAVITKIDKERYGYDIELSNDLELKFNKKGQVMEIDD